MRIWGYSHVPYDRDVFETNLQSNRKSIKDKSILNWNRPLKPLKVKKSRSLNFRRLLKSPNQKTKLLLKCETSRSSASLSNTLEMFRVSPTDCVFVAQLHSLKVAIQVHLHLASDRWQRKKRGDSIPPRKKSRKSSETVQFVQLQCYTGKILDSSFGTCHFSLHLATDGNGDHRSHPYVIFQFFSNLRAREGSNIFPKRVPAGASLAPTLEQRVLVPNPQPITISKAFDLPGSSAFALLPKVQGPVETPLRKISLRTLLCPFATDSCTKIYHVFYWNANMFECNPAIKLVSIRIWTFFPICPRRCTHPWAFAAPANPTQQGLEQKIFPKSGILTVLFAMMTSFMILRLKDCMNLSFSISSLKKTRQSPGFFQIRALSTPSIYSTQQPI